MLVVLVVFTWSEVSCPGFVYGLMWPLDHDLVDCWKHQLKVVIMELIHNIALKILGGTGVEDLDPFRSKVSFGKFC